MPRSAHKSRAASKNHIIAKPPVYWVIFIIWWFKNLFKTYGKIKSVQSHQNDKFLINPAHRNTVVAHANKEDEKNLKNACNL